MISRAGKTTTRADDPALSSVSIASAASLWIRILIIVGQPTDTTREIATISRLNALLCAFALALGLAGCVAATVDETVLPARIDYVCASDRVLPVARAADGRLAAVLLDGKEVTLQRAGSAAQENYSDGRHILYLDGERAMLEENGKVLFGPCASPVALPSAPRYR